MTGLNHLENHINIILKQNSPDINDVMGVLVEIEEQVSTPAFESIPYEDREKILEYRRNLRNLLDKLENQATGNEGLANADNQGEIADLDQGDSTEFPESLVEADKDEKSNSGKQEKSIHSSQAEEWMEEAEKFFYSGRYAEALKSFEKVLEIEPDWERARQHRSEAENYLRSGYIPTIALPAEAAALFGKSQSAARVGRYTDAMGLLQKAQTILKELGIQRWQEGQEFEQKLQQNIDAETVYEEGLKFFNQGKIDEALDRVDAAFRATALPKYSDKTQEFRKVRETLRTITEVLNSSRADSRMLSQAKADLDAMSNEYGENPAIVRLKTRLEMVIPRLVGPLKDKARSTKIQAERARNIENAMSLAQQSLQLIEQVQQLDDSDISFDRMHEEVDKLIDRLKHNEDQLQKALELADINRSWPAEASRISEEVRHRFPSDPGVVELKRKLAGFHFTLQLIKAGGILTSIILVILVGIWIYGRVDSYILSLTPSPTPTYTPTTTPTITSTPTLTPTLTITPTIPPTLTPIPLSGITQRQVVARNGCYENFVAQGTIPEGSLVRILPSDRRFDNLNRECILIEYRKDDRSILGWVLIADVLGR